MIGFFRDNWRPPSGWHLQRSVQVDAANNPTEFPSPGKQEKLAVIGSFNPHGSKFENVNLSVESRRAEGG